MPQAALDALQDAEPDGTTLPAPCRELIRSARLAGASWDQIGDALGLTAAQARSGFVQSATPPAASPSWSSVDLDEDDLMKLAVAETKAVRRLHSSR